jgi:hypothetical protein
LARRLLGIECESTRPDVVSSITAPGTPGKIGVASRGMAEGVRTLAVMCIGSQQQHRDQHGCRELDCDQRPRWWLPEGE